MKLKIIAKIIAKTFAVVFRRLNSYITAAIRAPQLKSTHTPKGRRLVWLKMFQISKHIVSVAIKGKCVPDKRLWGWGREKKLTLDRTRWLLRITLAPMLQLHLPTPELDFAQICAFATQTSIFAHLISISGKGWTLSMPAFCSQHKHCFPKGSDKNCQTEFFEATILGIVIASC